MRVPIWSGSNGAAAARSRPSPASSSDLRTMASHWRLTHRLGRQKRQRREVRLAPAEPRLDGEEAVGADETERGARPPLGLPEKGVDLVDERPIGGRAGEEEAAAANEALG